VLELINQNAKLQQEAQKKQNIARKTARPISTLQIDPIDGSVRAMINDTRESMVQEDPKAILAARTRERLARFGIVSLRVHDVYSLKRVWIDPNIIKTSPSYNISPEPLNEEDIIKEQNVIQEMRDSVYEQNPYDTGNIVFG